MVKVFYNVARKYNKFKKYYQGRKEVRVIDEYILFLPQNFLSNAPLSLVHFLKILKAKA